MHADRFAVPTKSSRQDNLLNKQHETVAYGWYLRLYITETKALGATPLICSLVPPKNLGKTARSCRNGSDYAGWAAEVAKAEGVPFLDLNNIIADRYDQLRPDR